MKKLSTEAAVSMAAMLALHDIECGNIEQAKLMLQYLVDKQDINDIKSLLSERLKAGGINNDHKS